MIYLLAAVFGILLQGVARAMAYNVKPGASIVGLHPSMWVALPAIEAAYLSESDGVPAWITSGTDSHTSGSHPDGRAVDLRTRNLAPGKAERIASRINTDVALQFPGVQAILEDDHIHVQRRAA